MLRAVGTLALLTSAMACGAAEPLHVVAISFNTGTADISGTLDPADNGGWGSALARTSGMYYGHGLAFPPMIEQVHGFLLAQSPDIIGFQELFYSGDCPQVPPEGQRGFVCETWKMGDPTVVELLLGAGYQIACHPGRSDNCIGVKKSFGAIRDCGGDFCLEGLRGAAIDGCGRGARTGRAIIDLAQGGSLTAVNIHCTAGFKSEDSDCRTKQYAQAFADLQRRALIFGDMNTDPIRLHDGDPSAAALLAHTGNGTAYHFVSDLGPDAIPTYGGLFNIDHLISDVGQGSCWSAGASPEHPPVTPFVMFDHKPLVCALEVPN
ncbi:MAG: hypothetical protein U1E65_03410 [Myxococcota bacterium]